MIKDMYKKTVSYIDAIESIINKEVPSMKMAETYKNDPFSVLCGRISPDIVDSLQQHKGKSVQKEKQPKKKALDRFLEFRGF